MTGVWITLSTRWEFADVQAALNVVISILGAIGIWAFSRFWWQRAAKRVLANGGPVSLSSLFTFTGLGDAWDVTIFFSTRLFTRDNWKLLVQLIVVVTATLLTMFAGPLARISLRSESVVRSKETGILEMSKGGGSFGNLLVSNVLWNDTITSLNSAGFPLDQMLEYVPSPSTPWVYRETEWDPTWRVDCNYTDEIELHQLEATGNNSLKDPTEAYPDFRNTFELFWLNTSTYRREIRYQAWFRFNENPQLKQIAYFIWHQTDPEIDDQLYRNQNPLHFSLTAFHLQNVQLHSRSEQLIGSSDHTPVGIAGKASYTRTQCVVTRKPQVKDELKIPWLWTNETQSIAIAVASLYGYALQHAGAYKTDFKIPSAQELLRFYQAYMSSVNTNASPPSSRKISIRVRAVELSCITLTIILLIFVLTVWNSARYLLFVCVHEKAKIEKVYIPDSRLEWMVHTAKNTNTGSGQPDRDRFRDAKFINHDVSRPGHIESSQMSIPTISMTETGALGAKVQSNTSNSGSYRQRSASTVSQSSGATLKPENTPMNASSKTATGASSIEATAPSTATLVTASSTIAQPKPPNSGQAHAASPKPTPSTPTRAPLPNSTNTTQVNTPTEELSPQLTRTV